MAIASLAVILLAGGCASSPSVAPTTSPLVAAADSPRPMPAATTDTTFATHVVNALDNLSTIVTAGSDAGSIDAWANTEMGWVGATAGDLNREGRGLEAYSANIGALNTAVTAGTDEAVPIAVLLAMRDQIASSFGLTIVAPTPAPTDTPVPIDTPSPAPILPASYATLTSRAWAKVVKSPDSYLGSGYKIWACISQFDAATGLDTFRGQASYSNEPYWYTNGINTFFTGDATQLSDFVTSDVVLMSVVSLGSYTYTNTSGGSNTVPEFQVVKIARKGSC